MQKSLNLGFFTKIYYYSSSSLEATSLKFFNKTLGVPSDYGIDLGDRYHFGWLIGDPMGYKDEKLFGECAISYLDTNHVQLEWSQSNLGFSQAVMFLDFNLILPEDFIWQQKISEVLASGNKISWTFRPLSEVYFECIYVKGRTFRWLSSDLIQNLKSVNCLTLKLGEHTSSNKLLLNQFFFSDKKI